MHSNYHGTHRQTDRHTDTQTDTAFYSLGYLVFDDEEFFRILPAFVLTILMLIGQWKCHLSASVPLFSYYWRLKQKNLIKDPTR